jgi:hypothetical protein
MQLSKNFTLREMTKSGAATRYDINNEPSLDVIVRMMALAAHVLQPLRDFMGTPVSISSGYRSKELNDKIGGSRTSQHCTGEAADIDCDGRNRQVFEFIKDHLDFDQLIWEYGDNIEPDWVHVSYRESGNRRQVLVSKKNNGKTVYENYG